MTTTKKSTVTKAQLVKAAKLRGEGATWNAIRTATGTKLSSSAWFRAWEKAEIEHVPARERVKVEKPKAAKPKATTKPARKKATPKEGNAQGARALSGGAHGRRRQVTHVGISDVRIEIVSRLREASGGRADGLGEALQLVDVFLRSEAEGRAVAVQPVEEIVAAVESIAQA